MTSFADGRTPQNLYLYFYRSSTFALYNKGITANNHEVINWLILYFPYPQLIHSDISYKILSFYPIYFRENPWLASHPTGQTDICYQPLLRHSNQSHNGLLFHICPQSNHDDQMVTHTWKLKCK